MPAAACREVEAGSDALYQKTSEAQIEGVASVGMQHVCRSCGKLYVPQSSGSLCWKAKPSLNDVSKVTL